MLGRAEIRSAWRKGNKKLYKVVDGRKILKEKEVIQENVTLNKKLNKILNEDRRKLTKEYAPMGFAASQWGYVYRLLSDREPLVKLSLQKVT